MYDYFATHGLISDEDAQKINKYCDFSPGSAAKTQNPECIQATEAADRDTYFLDIYNIYAPLCTLANNTTPKPKKASVSILKNNSLFFCYIW